MVKKSPIPLASSMTHQHLVAVINTEISTFEAQKTITVLDLGFGDGKLICHMLDAFPVLQPEMRFEIFGLDVSDAGQQTDGYLDRTVEFLRTRHPEVNFSDRLIQITTRDHWPFPENTFDIIVSNQVMEHVADHAFVFGEIHRCLRPSGLSVSLFPLREILWEGHASMPLVHKVRNERARATLMLMFAKIGFRKQYLSQMSRHGWKTLKEYSDAFAHIIETDTNYLTTAQLREVANRAKLQISFRYTKNYFWSKILSYFNIHPYIYGSSSLTEYFGLLLGKRIASSTVSLRKIQ